MKKVVKRDGRLVNYDRNKILSAIQKANNQVCENERANEELIKKIISNIENVENEQIPVESIQDIIEQKLMEEGKYVLVKTYIIYRYTRKLVRETNTTDNSILSLVQCKNKYVMEENSNKNAYIASTQRDLIAGEVSKDLTKRLLLPEKISKAHEEGVIHFHDADYFLQPIFNCFSRKTRFITDEGVKAFGDCKDGEIVNVLDKDGRWRQAKVRNYGKKPMVKVIMTSGRSSKEIVCTANHRWILGDGTITTNLKVGDTLTLLKDTTNTIDSILPLLQNTTNTIKSIMTKQQAISFCIGFIIGDGADHTSSSKYSYTFVRLCKEKIKYVPIFKFAGWSVSHPDSFQGDAQAIKKNSFKQSFLTSNSWKYMSLKDKQYLFMGYMAADGYKDRNGVGTTDERIECMIEDISALAGYHIASKRKIVHNTPYKKNATLTEYRFRKHQNINNHWIIKSIEPYRYNELKEAWCVEEPITHSFTLDGGVVTGNCCLINIKDMLDNGTVMNAKLIESPKSFRVACTVMTQIISAVASSQYGGQSVDVRHLGKYLRKSREKYRKHYTEKYGDQISTELMEQFIHDRLMDELKSGVQTIQYQINTLMTTNGQSPFVTLFLNLDPADEYIEENALIIEEILKQRLEGIKNEKGVYVTPSFPKLIYVLDEHNCLKGGKYDYITKLAVKCSSKRLYPDYISAKKMRENYEGNVFSCMGCVDGKSVINYKIDEKMYVESFERAWERLIKHGFSVSLQPNGKDKYIDTKGVKIWDTKEKRYVENYRFIRNTQKEWYDVTFTGGRNIEVTNNHPFEIEGKGIVFAKDLVKGDSLLKDNYNKNKEPIAVDKKQWLMGLILCDGCYATQVSLSLALNELDILNNAQEVLKCLGYESYVKEWHRGKKGNYYELKVSKSGALRKECLINFEGEKKEQRHIPSYIFSSSRQIKLSFLAGMIDADGYLNSSHRALRVQLGSTNQELAIQQMLLANSLGLHASIYKNHYNRLKNNKIRYSVEFNCTEEIYQYIVSSKKKKHFNQNHKFYQNVLTTSNICSVVKIKHYTEEKYSYDVTTESEHFMVNGIYSHNCRSFLSPWKDENGNYKFEGRFNQGVVSLNLPQIGIVAEGDEEQFWKILEERLELCFEALMCRHKALEGIMSDISPIHWQYGAIARLEKGEKIDKLLHDGYSTISLGYIGLYEVTKLMTGVSHTEPKGTEFALKLMKRLKEVTDTWKEETGLGFGLYGTPAESLCYRFAKIDREKFGDIEDVTDKGYYTNSYHVDVREKIDALSKFVFESQFQDISSGGAISYVEIPNMRNNLEALEDIVKFIYDNIQYAEFNTKSDYCHCCGFDGEILINEDLEWECPQCHNKDHKKMNVTRRTCGYIGENFWNVGKTKEIKSRVLHV